MPKKNLPDQARYTYVYHPSRAHKERWEALARKAHVPLSRFIIETVDESIAENEELPPRGAVVKEVESLKNEVKLLQADLRQKEIVIDRYEAELRRYRSEAFLRPDFKGTRSYSKELVDLLKARGPMDPYSILASLGIDPREAETVKAISQQLDELEAFGVIEPHSKGYRWTG